MDTGQEISLEECARRWRAWTPAEVHARLAHLDVAWGIAAGWSVDLFLGRVTREHDDVEITVAASSFPAVAAALAGFEWDVVGSGRLWRYPDSLDRSHQTWLRNPATGRYHVDVFREPHAGDRWTYRRDPSITLPSSDLYARDGAGIPFVVPEVTLLFKSKAMRPKDQADFDQLLPALDDGRRSRLRDWLQHTDPDHVWLSRLG